MVFSSLVNKIKGVFKKPNSDENIQSNIQQNPTSEVEQTTETSQQVEANEITENEQKSEQNTESPVEENQNFESPLEESNPTPIEEIQEEVQVQEIKPSSGNKIIIPNQREDARKFIHIDLEKLELSKIERESETITAYYKLLSKDVANYKDAKSDSYISSIEKKYKMIFIHAMELKNLLSALNELFYEYLINNIAEDHVSKPLLEEGQKKVIEIIGMLAKLGLYDELFNPEKSPEKYSENIDSEIHKGVFMKDTEELSKYLAENINNKKSSISTNVGLIIDKIKQNS